MLAVAIPGPNAEGAAKEAGGLIAGARAAVARLNSAGGLRGESVRVTVTEDGCTADGALAAARSIIAAQPAAVIGHPCPSAATAAAREYAAAHILFLAVGPRHSALTDRRAGPTVFRLGGRDDRQGSFSGLWLAEKFPGQPLALISDRTLYARRLIEQVRATLVSKNNVNSTVIPIIAGEKDYPAQIAQLKKIQPVAIYFAGFPLEAAVIYRELRTLGLSTPILGADAIAAKELSDAIANSPDGVIHAVRPIRPITDADWSLFADVAVEAWAAAALASANLDGPTLAATLQSKPFDIADVGNLETRLARTRIFGRTSGFDGKGDATAPFYEVLELRGGTLRPVQ